MYLIDNCITGVKIETNLCTQCNLIEEDIVHLFVTCSVTQEIWTEVRKYLYNNGIEGLSHRWEPMNILWNTVDINPRSVVNLITLVVKQYLYRKRCASEPPKVEMVIQEINNIREIEYYLARRKGKLSIHYTKWSSFYDRNVIEANNTLEQYIAEYFH